MNTFLPYPCYRKSAAALDRQRLGKQRVEALQLVNTILYDGKAWKNHPCTIMWRPWVLSLVKYGMIVCEEWMSRGYKDDVWWQLHLLKSDDSPKPCWLGSPKLHLSHRANLVRKDPKYYKAWNVIPQDGYFWPGPRYYWPLFEKATNEFPIS